jgi:hypothetical protein
MNPIATIASVGMMLRYSLALDKEADAVDRAVENVLKDGYRTYDIMSETMKKVGTEEMGDLISKKILDKSSGTVLSLPAGNPIGFLTVIHSPRSFLTIQQTRTYKDELE